MKPRINISEEARQRILWFENHHLNYEVIKTYYPKFYDRIKEMQAILFAQGYMLDEIEMALEVVLNNMFIISMDERNVSELEKFLNITPLAYQTLDDRKNVLLSHFRGNGSISMSELESAVATVCDGKCEGNLFTVDTENNRGVRFRITDSDMRNALNEVISTIMQHIPAHLLFEIIYEPIKTSREINEFVQLSQRTDDTISTAGQRTERVQGSPKAFVQSSQSPNNVIKAQMVIYDSGSFTDEHEDIIDGGGFTSPVSDNVLDFNY